MSNIWDKLKKRCPKCNSTNIYKENKYRRKWYTTKKGKWKIKEERLYVCNVCKYVWWN